MHFNFNSELPFWLGWNVGIADGSIKSIDLAKAFTDRTVAVSMESHFFGTQEGKWDLNVQRPPALGINRRFGAGGGASGTEGRDENFEKVQEKQGVVAEVSKESVE